MLCKIYFYLVVYGVFFRDYKVLWIICLSDYFCFIFGFRWKLFWNFVI